MMAFFLAFCVSLLASTVTGQEEIPGCGDISLSGPEGTFTSPNHPDEYENDLFCVWRITAPKPYQKIELVASDIDIEEDSTCNFDALEVYDGPSNTSTQLAEICDEDFGTETVRSTTQQMLVIFRTDGSVVETGFTATYRAVDCATSLRNLNSMDFSDKPKTSPSNLQNAVAGSGAVYKGKSTKNVIFDITDFKKFSIVSGTITTKFASVVLFSFTVVNFDNDGEEVFEQDVFQVAIKNTGKWTTTTFNKPDKKMAKLTITLTWDGSLTKKKEKKIQVKDMQVGACLD